MDIQLKNMTNDLPTPNNIFENTSNSSIQSINNTPTPSNIFADVKPIDNSSVSNEPTPTNIFANITPTPSNQLPSNLQNASKQIGSQAYIHDGSTWCEKFVEDMTGSGWQGSSAADAWNNYLQNNKAVADPKLNGIQPGDIIYFQGASEPDGHTGIYAGNNQFIGAAEDGVQIHDINDWDNQWQQLPLGYIPQGGGN